MFRSPLTVGKENLGTNGLGDANKVLNKGWILMLFSLNNRILGYNKGHLAGGILRGGGEIFLCCPGNFPYAAFDKFI